MDAPTEIARLEQELATCLSEMERIRQELRALADAAEDEPMSNSTSESGEPAEATNAHELHDNVIVNPIEAILKAAAAKSQKSGPPPS